MAQEIHLITGGGTGLGRALAHAYADLGKDVLVVGRRAELLHETASYAPKRIVPLGADVATEEGRRLVRESVPTGAFIRRLVHNAAVLGPVRPLLSLTESEWRNHMSINLDAPLFLTGALRPFMRRGTRILHISSGAAHSAYSGWGPYCTSKAGLHMLYLCLDKELKNDGIRVGSARPGVMDTPMQAEVRSASSNDFPMAPRFQALKQNGELSAPEDSAAFMVDLLEHSGDETFAAREYDFREGIRFKSRKP